MTCHVRSLPPLSSGSSRFALSQRMFMTAISPGRAAPGTSCRRPQASRFGRNRQPLAGQSLHALSVDVRAVPELEIEETPEGIATRGLAGGVRIEKPFDGCRLDDAALTASGVEQYVPRHVPPCPLHPHCKRDREPHFFASK